MCGSPFQYRPHGAPEVSIPPTALVEAVNAVSASAKQTASSNAISDSGFLDAEDTEPNQMANQNAVEPVATRAKPVKAASESWEELSGDEETTTTSTVHAASHIQSFHKHLLPMR